MIIQNNIGNEYSPTTIVAAIASRQKKAYPFHVEFTAVESGLQHDGTVLHEQILTIDQARLVRCRGQIAPARMGEVDAALKRSLALE